MGSRSEKLSSLPLPHSPYHPRPAKCQAPSLGPFISHRPGPPLNHPSPSPTFQMSPSRVRLTSRTIPDSSPAHLPSLPHLCSMPSVPPLPSSSPRQTPQLSLLAPPFSQALSQPPPVPRRGSFPLPSFSILHVGLAQLSPFTRISSPRPPPTPPPALRSLPGSPALSPKPPEHLLGKRRGLLTWRPQSSGAAAPSGRGGKCTPTVLPSPLVPHWEWTSIAACPLLLRLDLGGFLDSCFLGMGEVKRSQCDPEMTSEKFCWGRGMQRLRCPIGSLPRLCLKSDPFSPALCSRPPSPLAWIDCGIHLRSLMAPSQIFPQPEGS